MKHYRKFIFHKEPSILLQYLNDERTFKIECDPFSGHIYASSLKNHGYRLVIQNTEDISRRSTVEVWTKRTIFKKWKVYKVIFHDCCQDNDAISPQPLISS